MKPLAPGEHTVLTHFLKGSCRELFVLRHQLDSLRFDSRFYRRRRFLGIPYWHTAIRRRGSGLRMHIDWGIGAEDWRLGDRRPFSVGDVVARLQNGELVRFELQFERGLLHRLRTVEIVSRPGASPQPFSERIDRLQVAGVLYVSPADLTDKSFERLSPAPPAHRETQFAPPLPVGVLSEWQKWFLSLAEIEIPPPTETELHLPLGVRRARPAPSEEIEDLEAKHGFRLAEELKEFWQLSNGAAFFGWTLCGTYDTVFLDWQATKERRLLLVPDMHADGSILTSEVFPKDQQPPRFGKIFQYAPGAKEPLATWGGLRECLEAMIAGIRSR